MEKPTPMTLDEIMALWDYPGDRGAIKQFAHDVGVSTKTVYAWRETGQVPVSRLDGLHYRIIPRQRAKLKRLEELNSGLEKDYGSKLFSDDPGTQ